MVVTTVRIAPEEQHRLLQLNRIQHTCVDLMKKAAGNELLRLVSILEQTHHEEQVIKNRFKQDVFDMVVIEGNMAYLYRM